MSPQRWTSGGAPRGLHHPSTTTPDPGDRRKQVSAASRARTRDFPRHRGDERQRHLTQVPALPSHVGPGQVPVQRSTWSNEKTYEHREAPFDAAPRAKNTVTRNLPGQQH